MKKEKKTCEYVTGKRVCWKLSYAASLPQQYYFEGSIIFSCLRSKDKFSKFLFCLSFWKVKMKSEIVKKCKFFRENMWASLVHMVSLQTSYTWKPGATSKKMANNFLCKRIEHFLQDLQMFLKKRKILSVRTVNL